MVSHILVPLTPPFMPKTALMMAAALATEQSAHVTLLYVNDKPGLFAGVITPAAARKQIKRFLGDAAAIVAEFGLHPWTKVARGTPAYRVIKNVAKQIAADAIVLGTQRHPASETPVYDMTTRAVLSETDVPVLVVHEFRASDPSVVTSELAT